VSEQTLISAVIPTYNRAQTIARAIQSVLDQEHQVSELIIIDDGSEDGTRKIVEGFGDKVRYVYQSNGGVSAARNLGVKEARSEWVAFLDSDDYWLPGHLRDMANAIGRTEGRAALYFSDLQRAENAGGGSHWEFCGFKIGSAFELNRDATDWAFMRIQPMMLQASVIRREIYLRIGGLPPNLKTREDTLLFFKLGLGFRACAVSGCSAIMTDDGTARLTLEFHSDTITYASATICMFEELLAITKSMPATRRYFVKKQLSDAHYLMSRTCYKQKRYPNCIKSLLCSLFINPITFVKCVLVTLSHAFRIRSLT
jgi:glycosyltransferase involved in cell wall biosynthesis